MPQSTIQSDLYVGGSLTVLGFTPPAGSIGNGAIQAGAQIDATKLIHQYPLHYQQKAGTAVVAETAHLHVVYGTTASLVAIDILTPSPPTSTDTVTIDVKKGNVATAFATVLTAPVVLSSSTVARTVVTAALAVFTLFAGDILEVVVTVSGTSCQGLLVEAIVREQPQ